MKNRLFTRIVAVICIIALLSISCGSADTFDYPFWKLEGRWRCYYSYSEYDQRPAVGTEFYTFWDISGDMGRYRYENTATGDTYSGTFSIIKYSDGMNISLLVGEGIDFTEEFVYDFTWGPNASEFSLSTFDIYLARYMKE